MKVTEKTILVYIVLPIDNLLLHKMLTNYLARTKTFTSKDLLSIVLSYFYLHIRIVEANSELVVSKIHYAFF